jgi:phosphoribosylanthranilate isomerase
MMPLAKICGLTTAEAVDAALKGGAAFLGFNVFPASPRYVELEAASRLAARARGRIRTAVVTVDPDDRLLERIARVLAPDFIQLHGRESPARLADIRNRFGGGIIKAVPVASAEDLAAAAEYEALADHLMFDAKPPAGAAIPGGNGVTFNWSLLSGRRFDRPWFLAGGLDPWNVGEAVRLSGAPMVDVSSGVERGAGLKDPALIGAFLEAVRRT